MSTSDSTKTSDKKPTVFYILVDGPTEGMALYQALRAHDLKVRIAPAPHGQVACCGMSIMVEPRYMPAVRSVLQEDSSLNYDRVVEVEDLRDSHRDVYC